MPCPTYKDGTHNGRLQRGPPTTNFHTVDAETLDYNVFELEASQKLGRVHMFIRDHRHEKAVAIIEGVRRLLAELEQYYHILEIRSSQTGSWAGLIMVLGY